MHPTLVFSTVLGTEDVSIVTKCVKPKCRADLRFSFDLTLNIKKVMLQKRSLLPIGWAILHFTIMIDLLILEATDVGEG